MSTEAIIRLKAAKVEMVAFSQQPCNTARISPISVRRHQMASEIRPKMILSAKFFIFTLNFSKNTTYVVKKQMF